jgi:hypothetical protein
MASGIGGMFVLLLLAHGCVRNEPAATARLKNITQEQAIVMVSGAKWEQSLCLEGMRADGGGIRLEKIHPKDRERYAQGESPRLSRRPHFLRGWGYGKSEQVFTRGTRTSGAVGVGAARRTRVPMGSDGFDREQDWVHPGELTEMGASGRA